MSDPRDENKRHKLIDIIFITICAVICNADKWEDVEDFGKAKYWWLKRYLELPHGIPAHDTFNRVFAKLNPEEFNKRFVDWVKSLSPLNEEEIVNLDGKTVRHSFDTNTDSPAIHMVSAWANEAGMTLRQIKVEEKSNEITAIPELLDLLELEGCVVTIDAMGTQKTIAEKIIDKNANYLLALKGNQGTLKEDVELYFEGIDEKHYDRGVFDYNKNAGLLNRSNGYHRKRSGKTYNQFHFSDQHASSMILKQPKTDYIFQVYLLMRKNIIISYGNTGELRTHYIGYWICHLMRTGVGKEKIIPQRILLL